MTLSACDINVLARQLESRQIVIEGGWLPSIGIMTSAATCAELTIVGIILFVA